MLAVSPAYTWSTAKRGLPQGHHHVRGQTCGSPSLGAPSLLGHRLGTSCFGPKHWDFCPWGGRRGRGTQQGPGLVLPKRYPCRLHNGGAQFGHALIGSKRVSLLPTAHLWVSLRHPHCSSSSSCLILLQLLTDVGLLPRKIT